MKKLFTLAILTLTLVSCDEDQSIDCNCDEVISVPFMFNEGGYFKTKNDCTGEIKYKDTLIYGRPKLGDCR